MAFNSLPRHIRDLVYPSVFWTTAQAILLFRVLIYAVHRELFGANALHDFTLYFLSYL